LPVPGAQLYFRAIGDGLPLVILHGGPDFSHGYLLPELDRLSGALRLIYYDQRGRGRSSDGVSAEDVTLESEVDDIDRLRQYFGFDSIALLGHSWGGLLAMEYATRHSNRVSHLILLNSAPGSHADLLRFRQQREAAEPGTLATMRAIASTPQYADGEIESDLEYYRLHFSATVRRPDQLESIVQRLRTHFTPKDIVKARAIEDRLYARTWRVADYDVLARLRGATMPTLVIHGDRDLIPMECAKHVAEAVSGSRLVVLSGCGHFSYLEQPAQVVEAIFDFVSQC